MDSVLPREEKTTVNGITTLRFICPNCNSVVATTTDKRWDFCTTKPSECFNCKQPFMWSK